MNKPKRRQGGRIIREDPPFRLPILPEYPPDDGKWRRWKCNWTCAHCSYARRAWIGSPDVRCIIPTHGQLRPQSIRVRLGKKNKRPVDR